MDIVFDFDGVLCEYEGWRGHDKIGEPIKEMIEFVKDCSYRGYTLKLSTTRLNPHPFGDSHIDEDVTNGTAELYIINWLREQGILGCFSEITGYKPFGDIYIDDRGFYYDQTNANRKNDLQKRLEIIQNKKDEVGDDGNG